MGPKIDWEFSLTKLRQEARNTLKTHAGVFMLVKMFTCVSLVEPAVVELRYGKWDSNEETSSI